MGRPRRQHNKHPYLESLHLDWEYPCWLLVSICAFSVSIIRALDWASLALHRLSNEQSLSLLRLLVLTLLPQAASYFAKEACRISRPQTLMVGSQLLTFVATVTRCSSFGSDRGLWIFYVLQILDHSFFYGECQVNLEGVWY